MTYLLFAVALSLSAVAAYYAVMGLVAIFAAAVIPIAIMGSLLEASKLVVASWLYRTWKEIPVLMKSYFIVALVVLMMLTSMGIFGFLSKAHLDQAIPTGDVQAKLSLIDEKIKTEKENINAARKAISQLDSQVDQTIARTEDSKGAERSIAIRRGQQGERTKLLNEIGAAQTKISKLQEERAPIASEVRKVEAEVGPIKYIAALIYGDNPEEDVLEKSVRWVIIMIVLVFDPLAVLMLVAANWQLRHDGQSGKFNPLEIFIKEKPQTSIENIQNDSSEFKNVVIADEIKISEKEDISKTTENIQSDEELPEIRVDESKDWEPNLYQRNSVKKEVGRYLSEIEAPPPKTKSFLSKVQDIFSSSPGVNSIEQEIDSLQKTRLHKPNKPENS
jgi:hypothetical protein